MMKNLLLTNGEFAIVDDEDFTYLIQWRWGRSKNGYVRRMQFNKEKYKELSHAERWKANEVIYMHRLINNTAEGMHTDHINGNKLDNRKCNLRTATCSQNVMNGGMWSHNTSGYRGVYWNKGSWVATIKINQRNVHLGRYKDIQEAVIAREKAEETYCLITERMK